MALNSGSCKYILQFFMRETEISNFHYANMLFYQTFRGIVWFVAWKKADGDATSD
jgi:hypothetical protein